MKKNTGLRNFIIILFVSVFWSANCFGQTIISYHTPNIFTVGVAITPLNPTTTGGAATGFSISASFSSTGLTFNTTTGVIAGTPTKASDAEYSISATGASKPFVIKITINPAAPDITYASLNTYVVGTTIAELDPITIAGSVSKYSISPVPPAGLSFNTLTGAITGTPTAISATTEYTIVASNETGSSEPSKIKITVNPAVSSPSIADYISMVVVFLFCLTLLFFLLYITNKTHPNEKEALGLPRGSVRAIIAILFVVLFALLAVVFYFDSDANTRSTDLAKQILTILGTLVTAVSAFYFGAKATEQGHQIATEAFQQISNQTGQQDSPQDFNSLSSSNQDAVLNATIQSNYSIWTVKYPNINSCTAGFKTTANQQLSQKALVFGVTVKKAPENLQGSDIIPSKIYANGYWIPTDVIQKNPVVAHSSVQAISDADTIKYPGNNFDPSRIGTNVSRDQMNAFGSVSLKLKSTITDDIYLLSCFHALCYDQIQPGMFNDITEFIYQPESNTPVTVPGYLYRQASGAEPKLVGNLRKGVYSSVMDAAIVSINGGDLENNTFEDENFDEIQVTDFVYVDQLTVGMTVTSYGCVSGKSSGKILQITTGNFNVDVSGPNGSINMVYSNMICTEKISIDGDSGAPVVTADGRFIGIIVAGDNATCSYVLPYQYIVNKFNVSI